MHLQIYPAKAFLAVVALIVFGHAFKHIIYAHIRMPNDRENISDFENSMCVMMIIIQPIVWMHADCQMLLILLSKWCKTFDIAWCSQQYDASIEKRVLIILGHSIEWMPSFQLVANYVICWLWTLLKMPFQVG